MSLQDEGGPDRPVDTVLSRAMRRWSCSQMSLLEQLGISDQGGSIRETLFGICTQTRRPTPIKDWLRGRQHSHLHMYSNPISLLSPLESVICTKSKTVS